MHTLDGTQFPEIVQISNNGKKERSSASPTDDKTSRLPRKAGADDATTVKKPKRAEREAAGGEGEQNDQHKLSESDKGGMAELVHAGHFVMTEQVSVHATPSSGVALINPRLCEDAGTLDAATATAAPGQGARSRHLSHRGSGRGPG